MAVANRDTISSSFQTTLPFSPNHSAKAKIEYSFPDLQSSSLISTGQLCDDDCVTIFSKYKVRILKNNRIMIEEKIVPNGLWCIYLTHPIPVPRHEPPATMQLVSNGIIKLDKKNKNWYNIIPQHCLTQQNQQSWEQSDKTI